MQDRLVWTLGLGQLLAWGSSFYLLAVLGQPMAMSFGVTPLWVYAMFSLALLVSAAVGPFAGNFVDLYGGRRALGASNVAFATAHVAMALAPNPYLLAAAWALLGAAMPFGLYDAAFATLVRHRGTEARGGIVGITLIAGFASSVSWPLSHFLESHFGWRSAVLTWALLHLTLGLWLHRRLPVDTPQAERRHGSESPIVEAASIDARLMVTLMAIFAATGLCFASYAAHLPQALRTAGATAEAAIFAASWVGALQVLGRVLESAWLSKHSPLVSALVATALHPIGAALLLALGAPAALMFTALHGLGVGLMTIVKGTLPLALFGPTGFGRRAGLLEAPSKVLQATAPVVFGWALVDFGHWAIGALCVIASLAFLGVVWLWSTRRAQD